MDKIERKLMNHTCPQCNSSFIVEMDLNNIVCPYCGFTEVVLKLQSTIVLKSEIETSYKPIENKGTGKNKHPLFNGSDRIVDSHKYQGEIKRHLSFNRINGTETEILRNKDTDAVLERKVILLKDKPSTKKRT